MDAMDARLTTVEAAISKHWSKDMRVLPECKRAKLVKDCFIVAACGIRAAFLHDYYYIKDHQSLEPIAKALSNFGPCKWLIVNEDFVYLLDDSLTMSLMENIEMELNSRLVLDVSKSNGYPKPVRELADLASCLTLIKTELLRQDPVVKVTIPTPHLIPAITMVPLQVFRIQLQRESQIWHQIMSFSCPEALVSPSIRGQSRQRIQSRLEPGRFSGFTVSVDESSVTLPTVAL
ncbi:hypothetical protein SeLEV6574_g05072 [Synchytrium endobioticum]|uniref:Uncharacterized protein n=1 Tax=Synchytrium endobioticum TaxID=286115 RepID=A0A507CWD2_9FUNG|nr:hypothetical protein SeLEV6574_g05072 [Synchytrium endobioticum]